MFNKQIEVAVTLRSRKPIESDIIIYIYSSSNSDRRMEILCGKLAF